MEICASSISTLPAATFRVEIGDLMRIADPSTVAALEAAYSDYAAVHGAYLLAPEAERDQYLIPTLRAYEHFVIARDDVIQSGKAHMERVTHEIRR